MYLFIIAIINKNYKKIKTNLKSRHVSLPEMYLFIIAIINKNYKKITTNLKSRHVSLPEMYLFIIAIINKNYKKNKNEFEVTSRPSQKFIYCNNKKIKKIKKTNLKSRDMSLAEMYLFIIAIINKNY